MPESLRFALQGFVVAFSAALLLVPLCMAVARRLDIVDRPGGRKQHERVTPLLGGAAVFLSFGLGLWIISRAAEGSSGLDLSAIKQVLIGGSVLFVIGLIDDVFKDTLGFVPKLLGQIVGVLVITWPRPWAFFEAGAEAREIVYFVFLLLWYLTIVNSFNFSDNMNGLMSGLSVIAFSASVIYLGSLQSLRTMTVASLLVGALLGFLPYNFPRARIFLGDAGSMFVGYWMAWVMFDMSKGFMGPGQPAYGIHALVPGVLIMGVPLYDAAFVVVRRWVEKRPLYLGDDRHLSHRLVRGGFTPVEAVVMLWGLGIVLAGVGILASFAVPSFRFVLLGASLLLLVALTRVCMSIERHGSSK